MLIPVTEFTPKFLVFNPLILDIGGSPTATLVATPLLQKKKDRQQLSRHPGWCFDAEGTATSPHLAAEIHPSTIEFVHAAQRTQIIIEGEEGNSASRPPRG